MLAMCDRGPCRVRADHRKPEPRIEDPGDAIVRVTRACICGSDLHLYHGLVPDTRVGSTFGHACTGVVEAVGPAVIPPDMDVDDAVLLTDAFPTGCQAAEMGGIDVGAGLLRRRRRLR